KQAETRPAYPAHACQTRSPPLDLTTTVFGHLLETSESSPVGALLLLNSMTPVPRPLRQRNRLGPKWFQRARFRNQAIYLHVPYGETRSCVVEDQTERVFRQVLARGPCP